MNFVDKSYTVAQASKRIGCGRSQLYMLISGGELSPVQFDPIVLSAVDVDTYRFRHRTYKARTVSLAKAAEYLGIGKSSIYNWVAAGIIKAEGAPLRVDLVSLKRLKGRELLTNKRLVAEAVALGLSDDIRTLKRWMTQSRIRSKKVGRLSVWPISALNVLIKRAEG